MEYDEILQLADKILSELIDPSTLTSLSHGIVNSKFGYSNQTIESSYVIAALRRLSEDKFLDKRNGSSETFHVNGNTYAFKKQGGYKELVKKESSKKELKTALEELGLKSTQSVIDTNASIQELNKKTEDFYTKQDEFLNKQRTHNLINIGLTIAIMLATVVSGAIATCTYYDTKAENQSKAKGKSDLQSKVSHIESTLQSKISADSSFQEAVKDSLKMP